MANKDLKIKLITQNLLPAGLSQAQRDVKSFSRGLKGIFDIGAKPAAVLTAGLMAIKKAAEFVEEGFNGIGRVFRDLRTESLAKDFDNLKKSINDVSQSFIASKESFDSENKILESQQKNVRALEDANNNLAKSKKLMTATSAEQASAMEEEYKISQITLDAKRKEQDILDNVAKAKADANRKTQEANELQKESERLEAIAISNGDRSLEMQRKKNDLMQSKSLGTFASTVTGTSKKELDSLEEARKASKEISERSFEEKQALDRRIAKLRMEAVEIAKTTGDKQYLIEQVTAQQAASFYEIQAKNRIKDIEDRRAYAEKAVENEQKLYDILVVQKKKHVEEMKALEERKQDAEENLAEKEKKRNGQGLQDRINQAKKLAEMTVKEFLAKGKADEDKEKSDKKQKGRYTELRNRELRGTKLSKEQIKFMQAFELIEEAKNKLGKLQKQAVDEAQKKAVIDIARAADTLNLVLAEQRKLKPLLEAN
jgi:hypothetical protein